MLFLKICLWIYLGISILTFLSYFLLMCSLSNKIQTKHKIKKSENPSVSGYLLSIIKLLIISFIPIINIVFLLGVLFVPDLEKVTLEETEKILNEEGLIDV